MLALFQLMTLNSLGYFIRPIVFKAPEMTFLFFLWIGIAGIVLRNLLTAIMVKNAFDNIDNDVEALSLMKQSHQIEIERELHKLFNDLDEDHSGELSKDEFTDVLGEVNFMRKMKMLDIDLDELPEIFSILDDGDGAVTIQEFCDGIARMQGPASSRDMLNALYKSKKLAEGLARTGDSFTDFETRSLPTMEEALERSHEHFARMHMLTANILENINSLGIRRVVHASTTDLPALKEPSSNELAKATSKEVQPFTGATSMSTSAPARLESLPPAWVARRREVVRKDVLLQKKAHQQEKPHQEPKKQVVQASEWDNLQVNHSLLQPTGRGAKSPSSFTPTRALVLPSALVQRVATHPDAPVAQLRDGASVQKPPDFAFEHRRLTLI